MQKSPKQKKLHPCSFPFISEREFRIIIKHAGELNLEPFPKFSENKEFVDVENEKENVFPSKQLCYLYVLFAVMELHVL